MPPLLYDPPELTGDAARVDPPMSAWPGGVRYPRDRFRYGPRYEAYLRCWNAWAGPSAAPASRSYQGWWWWWWWHL